MPPFHVLTALAASAGLFEAFLWNLDDDVAAPAREFLVSRGISEETARRFHVGYVPDMKGAIVEVVPSLVDAGLMDRHGHSRFNDRLMFPVINAASETVGFIGRSLDAARPPKYLRTRSEIFESVPYGLHAAFDKADAAGGVMVIADGAMDVLALHEAGIEHAVGCFGTSVTPPQAKELSRYCSGVTFWTELDAAGSAQLTKACQVARDADLDPLGACNVFGNTAASALLTTGPEAMRLQLKLEMERQRVTAAESFNAASDLHVSLMTGGAHMLDFLAGCVAHPLIGDGLLRRALKRGEDLFTDRGVWRAAELLRDNIDDPHAALTDEEPEASVVVFEVIKYAARCDFSMAELIRTAADLGIIKPGDLDRPTVTPIKQRNDHHFLDIKAWEFLAACVKYPHAGGEMYLKGAFADNDGERHFPDPNTRKAARHLADHLPAPVVRPAEMTDANMYLWDLTSRVSLMGEAGMYLGIYDSPERLLRATWETVESAVGGTSG